MKNLKTALPYLAYFFIIIAFINFFWFVIESEHLGGDALNGYVRDHQYFVGSHGVYTQVSQHDWEWSRLHAITNFVTFPFGFFSCAYRVLRFKLPNALGVQESRKSEAKEHVQLVRASGPEIAARGLLSGIIGDVRLSMVIRLAVFPGGLIVRVWFTAPVAIDKADIRSITVVNPSRIAINHTGRDISSPLILYESQDSPIVRAIEIMAERQPHKNE